MRQPNAAAGAADIVRQASFLLVACVAACTDPQPPSEPEAPPAQAEAVAPDAADIVFRGGTVYTMDASRSTAEAVAVRDGRILAVGTAVDITLLAGPQTEIVDLAGGMVLPGFHDTHVHPMSGGHEALGCSLSRASTVTALLDKVRECASGGSGWLVGRGWSLALFPPDGNPRKALLDAVVRERPVFLEGIDGHSAWVNSAALTAAGIDARTPNPPLGVIERDADGEPTGTLRESAMRLVSRLLPPATPEQNAEALRLGLAEANGFGITSVIEASAGVEELAAYKDLADRDALNARVLLSIGYAAENFEQLLAAREDYRGKRLRPDAVKIFVDGVLEGETAALLEPYLDRPDFSGTLNYEPQPLAQAVTRIDGLGMQVHMHAIGDRAVRVGLDAIAAARAANPGGPWMHHIAHLQLVDAADLPRFAQLNVAANFQSLWAFPDAYITDINLPVVGEARVTRMYPIGSALRAGATIVGGSDWSVSSLNPLDAMQVAVTRMDPDGKVPAPLNLDERVDLPAILAAYTIDAARLMRQDDEVGSIEPGKAADLVVLDRNVLAVPANEIRTARVVRTLLDGETVYAAGAEPPVM
jgi:predicted amidohydrolase YtcJ